MRLAGSLGATLASVNRQTCFPWASNTSNPAMAKPECIAAHPRPSSPHAVRAHTREARCLARRSPHLGCASRRRTPADTSPQELSRLAHPLSHDSSDYYGRAQVALRYAHSLFGLSCASRDAARLALRTGVNLEIDSFSLICIIAIYGNYTG